MKFIGKFIISERRGAICSLRGRCKKGRGGGGGRGKGGGSDQFIFKKLFTKTAGSASEWFGPLTCQSIPHRRAHKNSRGLFIEQKYVITFYTYVENIENLHCINKNTGIPAPVWKKRSQRDCFTREILHKKKKNEKLVLICPPSPNHPLQGRKLWTFLTRCPGNILNFRRVLRVVFTPSGRKNDSN